MPKGYRLPDNIDPDDNYCVMVMVPKDPLYLTAFWGAYSDLGVWFNWERDALKRGKDAAARWRESILYTYQLWDEWGDWCEMEINISCNGGGGGQLCCNNLIYFNLDLSVHAPPATTDPVWALPGGTVDDGENVPVPGWPDYTTYLADKCASANALATDILASWESLAALGLAASFLSYSVLAEMVAAGAIAAAIKGILAGVITGPLVMTALAGAFLGLAAIAGTQIYQYFNQLQERFDLGALVCAMYGASTAAEAKDMVIAAFDEWGVEAGIANLQWGKQFLDGVIMLAQILNPVQLFEPLFDIVPWQENLPAADCSLCLGVQPGTPPVGGEENLLAGLLHYFEFEEEGTQRFDSHDEEFSMVHPSSRPMAKWLEGVTGLADWYNGSNNYNRRLDSVWYPPESDWTAAIWFRPEESTNIIRTVFGYGRRMTNVEPFMWRVYIETATGLLTAEVADGTTFNRQTFVTGAPSLNTWHLAIISYEHATKTFFLQLDNNEPSSLILDNDANYRSEYLMTGATTTGTGAADYFKGAIDEFAVWERLLTVAERSDLWNVGQGLSYLNIVASGEPA